MIVIAVGMLYLFWRSGWIGHKDLEEK